VRVLPFLETRRLCSCVLTGSGRASEIVDCALGPWTGRIEDEDEKEEEDDAKSIFSLSHPMGEGWGEGGSWNHFPNTCVRCTYCKSQFRHTP